MGRWLLLSILAAFVVGLILAPAAVAAGYTPQDVYDDFAAHHKLTHEYTTSELRAYLNDATIHQYGDQSTITELDREVGKLLSRTTFPFTGFQMAIAGTAAAALLVGGFLLRRVSRRT